MPTFVTQGRYTRDAIKGMIIKPDRADAISRVMAITGGRLIGYCLTFGEYDFLVIAEMLNVTQMAVAVLAAASTGGITDLHSNMAMTAIEAKGAIAAAGDLTPAYKSPGGA